MKTFLRLPSLAQPLRRLRVAALAGAAITWCGAAGAFDPEATCATETNALSRFTITVDGRFTPINSEGGPQAVEWSDIVPQVFVSDATGMLFRTCPGDPNASSYVYTSLDGGVDALYLMSDFVAETSGPSLFADGQTIAQVSFGVHLPAQFGGVAGQNTPITVHFVKSTPVIGTSVAAGVIGGGRGPRRAWGRS